MGQGKGRHDGGERQRQLIDATVTALARHGAAGVSVRLIAAEAGASAGLVTHHFGSVDHLIATAALHLADDILAVLDEAVERAEDHPRSRLMAFVSACFRPPVMTPGTIDAWLAITGLSRTMPAVTEARHRMADRLRERIMALMAQCVPDRSHRMPAASLAAMIEGLWTALVLEDTRFRSLRGFWGIGAGINRDRPGCGGTAGFSGGAWRRSGRRRPRRLCL